jgi:hypothetical protein
LGQPDTARQNSSEEFKPRIKDKQKDTKCILVTSSMLVFCTLRLAINVPAKEETEFAAFRLEYLKN